MQRIIVDLPEPEGPQTTTRSPRFTSKLMSVSTRKSPNHLWTWRISINGVAESGVSLSAIIDAPCRVRLTPPAPVELALQHLAVARHEKTEAPIDRRRDDVGFGREALPVRVGQCGICSVEQIEEANDDD